MAPAQRSRAQRPRRRDRQAGMLPAGATVTFAAERRLAGIDEVFSALDRDLVGLLPVKEKVQEIAALLLVDRARQKFGLEAPRPTCTCALPARPGPARPPWRCGWPTCCTALATWNKGSWCTPCAMTWWASASGRRRRKPSGSLTGRWAGVLFIDEAYFLYRDTDSKDYGQEAIDILLQVMENDRDKLVVILAGYKDRMDTFFGSNPGMSSRIAHHLDFAAYQVEELVAIGRLMLEEASYHLSAEAEGTFRDYLTRQMEQPRFANARSVRNELESARLRHAHRLASDLGRGWTRDDLMRLEPADILPPALAFTEHAAGRPAARSQA